ncbi:MAG: alpha/beta fold hydrolase, partial [Chloroflexi bacterium]|nr:alpha/beta fold hydrolase [Chloroflexota bacterium]
LPSQTDAQRPDAPTYAERGPFTVGTQEVRIDDDTRPLDVTIWYPADADSDAQAATYTYGPLEGQGQALSDAAPNTEAGPYPLIIFSHGSGGFRYQSVFYTEHLASYGFVVMAADHPGNTVFDLSEEDVMNSFLQRPRDVLRQLDYAEQLATGDGSLAGLIDVERVAITGHSFGGYTAVTAGGARLNPAALAEWCTDSSFAYQASMCQLLQDADRVAEAWGVAAPAEGELWPALTDPRIDAVVALAPFGGPIFGEAGMAAMDVPTMILVGSADEATTPQRDAYPMYENLGSPLKSLVVFQNAGHYIFVEECTDVAVQLGFYDLCSDDVWDMQRVHDLINHFATAFQLSTVMDDDEARQALEPVEVDFNGVKYGLVAE